MALRPSIPQLTLGLSLALSACAGAAPKQVGDENSFDQTPTKTPSETSETDTGSSDSAPSPSEDEGKLNEEQIKQMEVALRRGGSKASNCSTVVPDAPTGEGDVDVTFDGKIGKVTEVEVGAPFAGTPAESCIKRSFIGEYCLPFDGDPKVVKYKVKLPPPKGAAPAPKKK